MKLRIKVVFLFFLLFSSLTLVSNYPDDFRARFKIDSQFISKNLFAKNAAAEHLDTLKLNHNAEITILNYVGLDLESKIQNELSDLLELYHESFGHIPHFKTTIKLMSERDFFTMTGAPSWTNAIFQNNEIYIPIGKEINSNNEDLLKTLRHEFSHAIIASISNGHCPGWLDEGLAQWIEGGEHHELHRIMDKWLEDREIISFKKLQKGFTKLNNEEVGAAYAQSLFASRLLFKLSGKKKIGKYIREIPDNPRAFEDSFGFEQERFSKILEIVLRNTI